MEEEEDDFYAPAEPEIPAASGGPIETKPNPPPTLLNGSAVERDATNEEDDGDEEEDDGDEEEDDADSDSDIDIITERKDGLKPEAPAQPSRYGTIRNLPARTSSTDIPSKAPPPAPSAAIKVENPARTSAPTPPKSGADYPEVRTSKIDVDAVPIFEPAGKPVTELDIDEDLKELEKPWRIPGTDVSDFFNYGFDEFTWTLYCLKQDKMREQSQGDKKEFASGMMMGMDGTQIGMPGIPAAPANGAQAAMAMPQMPGMGDMPPEMQAMMAQMMASGMDPSQMDPSMFGLPPPGPVQGGANGQAQGFGVGQQGFGGQGQTQQPMNFGFDPSMMGGDAGRNRQGNFGPGGRGRGGGVNRRNW
ncbi:MAG: hypothetical protein M1825_003199 [Sarcosagium campestre]|nr:MAG: hypothetical protein M1825_003199 [Sarcosagium campestre]